MTPSGRKRLFNMVRIAVCVAALWIVVRGVTWRDHVFLKDGGREPRELSGFVRSSPSPATPMYFELPDGRILSVFLDEIAVDDAQAPRIVYGLRTAWRISDKGLLLLAVLVYFPVAFPLAVRFRLLLRAQDIHLGLFECVKLTFAGNFLNYATPLGSNAGDLFKAYFASLHTAQKTEAVTTVILDRIIGLGTLLVVATAITAFSPAGGRLAVLRPYLLTLLGAGLVAAAVYFSPFMRWLAVPAKWQARFPLLKHVERIDRSVRVLASHGRILVASVLLTAFLQIMALSSYFIAAVALAMNADAGNLLEYFAYFYTGAMVQALPGPPQGLGTVELAYRYFFADYGSPSQIVCMAFAIRLVGLVTSLPGLLVTLTGAYKPRDIEAAMAQIEASADPSPRVSDRSESAGVPGVGARPQPSKLP